MAVRAHANAWALLFRPAEDLLPAEPWDTHPVRILTDDRPLGHPINLPSCDGSLVTVDTGRRQSSPI